MKFRTYLSENSKLGEWYQEIKYNWVVTFLKWRLAGALPLVTVSRKAMDQNQRTRPSISH